MNRKSFALFLAAVFVAALIITPVLTPILTGMASNKGYEETVISNKPGAITYGITYDSHGDRISALLTIPKTGGRVPAFVIEPAVSITKESEQNHLGNALNALGYATFIIDPRGQGVTGGSVPSLASDYYYNYATGGYPVQYKMVDDLFRAQEILAERPEIEPGKIFMAGESAGGRHAIIAAALQDNFSGVLVISSSGYDFNATGQDQELVKFMLSVNPYSYFAALTPRKVAIVHGTNDTIIPLSMGRELFDAAAEPKKFYEAAGGHSFESITDRTFLKDAVEWLNS